MVWKVQWLDQANKSINPLIVHIELFVPRRNCSKNYVRQKGEEVGLRYPTLFIFFKQWSTWFPRGFFTWYRLYRTWIYVITIKKLNFTVEKIHGFYRVWTHDQAWSDKLKAKCYNHSATVTLQNESSNQRTHQSDTWFYYINWIFGQFLVKMSIFG